MIVRVHYHESLKDGAGNIHTYKAEVEKEIPDEGMTGEQQVVKMRTVMAFLHNEIHRSIQAAQMNDGLIEAVNHKDK